jgi:RNA polymerase sigma factor (sigma-70 family)
MGDAGADVAGLERPGDTGGDTPGDAAIIARSVDAPDCFAVLFDRHAPAIHSYVARRLGLDAADDLTAEAFLIAFQRRRAYHATQADARPWLYGIATNLIARRRREEARRLRAIARSHQSPVTEPFADQVTNRVAAQAVRGRLAHALGQLPRAQRDVLFLVASGLSCQETAAALGVPPGTVASRLARARHRVRAELQDANPSEF